MPTVTESMLRRTTRNCARTVVATARVASYVREASGDAGGSALGHAKLEDALNDSHPGPSIVADNHAAWAALAALPFAAVFLVDPDLRYREALGGIDAILDDPGQGVIGRSVPEVTPAAFAPRLEELFRRALAGESVSDIIATRGADRIYEGTFTPVVENGLVTGALAVFRDVTVERRALGELAATDALHRLLTGNTGDVVALSEMDDDDRCTWVSPSVRSVFGWRQEDIIGRGAGHFVHPDDVASMLRWRGEIVDGADRVGVTFRMRRPAGGWMWVEGQFRHARDDAGATIGLLAVLRDVSDRHRLEAELTRALAMFELAFAAAPIGIALVRPDGHWLRVNQALCTLLRREEATLLACSVRDVTHPDDIGESLEPHHETLVGTRTDYRTEKRFLRPDGTVVWVRVAVALVRKPDGAARFLILQVEDITERRRAQQEMERLATTDPLTGLPNRTLLMDRLRHSLGLARRENKLVGLLFVDLDYFKQVNNTLGHDAGDELLRRVAGRLAEVTRDGDTTTRLGGDEFVVVCPQVTSQAEVEQVAERIRAALVAPFVIGGQEVVISASVGVTVGDPDDAEQLLRDGDRAMYAAKHGSRGHVDVYAAALDDMAADRLAIHAALREGLTRGEVAAFFQPIVDLRTGRIVGQEALARWHHPTRGLLLPGAFLAGVDRSPVGVTLGEEILRQACTAAAGWDGAGVHVNVSAHHLATPRFAAYVATCLATAGLAPSQLVLEITESLVLTASRSTLKATADLHDLGVELCLDDFGTGYSSVTALHSLPIGAFKIDRSFVKGIGTDPASSGLVDGLVSLGTRMGLDVVAEGVETVEQHDWLVEHGCPRAQGYLFGRPTPEPFFG